MGITTQEAMLRLQSVRTINELTALIGDIDVDSSEGRTLLFSGNYDVPVGPGQVRVRSFDVAAGLKVRHPELLFINDMPIGSFLNRDIANNGNRALVRKLDELFDGDDDKISEYFYGPRDANGTRVPIGIWDIVSANLAAAAKGDVVTLTAGAREDGVFAQTELPVLLGNKNVNSVDGIPMQLLRRIGREEAFRLITATSELATARLRLAVNLQGDPILVNGRFVVDTSEFLPDLQATPAEPLPLGARYRHLEHYLPEDRLRLHQITVLKFRNLVQSERANNNSPIGGKLYGELSDLLDRLDEDLFLLDLAKALYEAGKKIVQEGLAAATSQLTNFIGDHVARFVGGVLMPPHGLPMIGGPIGDSLIHTGDAPPPHIGDDLVALLKKLWGDLAKSSFRLPSLHSLQEMINQLSENIINSLEGMFRSSLILRTPLVLDLDGNGVSTLSLREGPFHFDHDNNGFAERSGWVAPTDGLLVWDRDGDGDIRSGAELFGSGTFRSDGTMASHGFEALGALDGNRDGRIDSADSSWHQLRVWRDGNGNALADAGELSGLDPLQIDALELEHVVSSFVDVQGNHHRLQGTYRHRDGRQLALTDVWFAVNPTSSHAIHSLPVPAAIAALPDLPGMGQVASLHQVMAADPASPLPDLLRQWMVGSGQQRRALFLPILFAWTGVPSIEASPYGSDVNQYRLLLALEKLIGRPFGDLIMKTGLNKRGISNVMNRFPELRASLERLLSAQVDLPPLLNALLLRGAAPEEGFEGQVLWTHLERRFGAFPDAGLLQPILANLAALGPHGPAILNSLLQACEGRTDPLSRVLLTVAPTQLVHQGGSGSDPMQGSALADWMEGHGASDTLVGGEGKDVLVGGVGDDRLVGDSGADVYLFRRGDGRDRLLDNDSTQQDVDRIEWLDVPSHEIRVERFGMDLLLSNRSGDEVLVENHFYDFYGLLPRGHQIEQFRFSDGVVWNNTELLEQVVVAGATQGDDVLGGFWAMPNRIDGLAGDDTLRGEHYADRLLGGPGQDRLIGHGGSDYLDGGSGNDWLEAGEGHDTLVASGGHDTLIGGAGNDTYLIRRGRWQSRIVDHETMTNPNNRDEIRFLDLRSTEVGRVERLGDDLKLLFRNGDELRVLNHFFTFYGLLAPAFQIENLRFSDGVLWGQAEILQRLAAPAPL